MPNFKIEKISEKTSLLVEKGKGLAIYAGTGRKNLYLHLEK